jgi:hypothetical protein
MSDGIAALGKQTAAGKGGRRILPCLPAIRPDRIETPARLQLGMLITWLLAVIVFAME